MRFRFALALPLALVAPLGCSQTPTHSSSAEVGPAGGTVSASGAALVIPAGALSDTVRLEVGVADSGYPSFPSGMTAAGPVFAFTPHGQTFSAPVTVRVPHSTGATSPVLMTAEPSGAWQPVSGAALEGEVWSASVNHFSFFAVANGGGTTGTTGSTGETNSPPEGELVWAPSSSGFNPLHVRVDASHVYWTGQTTIPISASIYRQALTGGAVEALVSTSYFLTAFALTDTALYFTSDPVGLLSTALIRSVPLAGGSPSLVAGPNKILAHLGLAANASDLYVAGLDATMASTIERAPRGATTCSAITGGTGSCADMPCSGTSAGGLTHSCIDADVGGYSAVCCAPSAAFAAPQGPGSWSQFIVLAGSYAYWTENSSTTAWVLRKPLAGGGTEILHSAAIANEDRNSYQALAVSDARVYWFDLPDKVIRSVPLAGGTMVVEATDARVKQMASDASHVYYTGECVTANAVSNQGVCRLPFAGGSPEAVAVGTGSVGTATDIALSPTHVYWIDTISPGVYRIAK